MKNDKTILLIQPHVGKLDYAGLRLPEALLAVARYPLKHGFSVKIIDQRITQNWKKCVGDFLEDNNVLCVGLTCMTGPQIRYALEINRHIKSISSVPIVWGGVHPSLFPEQCLADSSIDYVVIGEGEETFMELILKLQDNESMSDVQGIAYNKNGKNIISEPRGFIKDMDTLPHLPYDLLDITRYRASGLFDGPSFTFFTSRGCPFPCTFCYNAVYNKGKWRGFSAVNTVDRLEAIIDKYGIRQFFLQDDNLFTNVPRFREIMREIIKRQLNIEWACLGARIDTLSRIGEEGLELMVKAGCKDVDIGVESGSDRILKMIKKSISTDQVLPVIRMLSKFPINSKCTFIIGFPGETEDEVLQTIKLSMQIVEENERVFSLILVYTPYPGSDLFFVAEKNGFVVPDRLEDWGDFTRDEWFLNKESWLTKRQRKRYNSICFTSMFASKAGKTKVSSPLLKVLFDLYYPIAKFRLKYNFHRFQIESYLQRKILSSS